MEISVSRPTEETGKRPTGARPHRRSAFLACFSQMRCKAPSRAPDRAAPYADRVPPGRMLGGPILGAPPLVLSASARQRTVAALASPSALAVHPAEAVFPSLPCAPRYRLHGALALLLRRACRGLRGQAGLSS